MLQAQNKQTDHAQKLNSYRVKIQRVQRSRLNARKDKTATIKTSTSQNKQKRDLLAECTHEQTKVKSRKKSRQNKSKTKHIAKHNSQKPTNSCQQK